MKRRTKRSRISSLPQLRASLLAATALSVLGSLAVAPAFAQSASWNGTTSSDWFDALNWTGAFPSPTVDVIVNGGAHSPKITGGGSAGAGNLRVGDAATGVLTIENGTLEAYNTAIGKAGGTGTITVDGASAVLRSSTPISVGGENGTGTLTVRNGGSVSTLQGVIGDGLGSTGTVTVDGPNSSWVTTGAGMAIGNFGAGHFTVSGGASVSNERAMLGLESAGHGTLVVTGAGSSWTDTGDMYVGFLRGSGTLEVRAGGSVEIFNSLYVSHGGEGIASVSGVGSTLKTHGGITVGSDRNGTFTVSDGATVNSGGGYIDAAVNYQGIATVTGAGSTWTMGDQLIMALEGKGSLTVTDGGRLQTTQITMGSRNGAEGTLTISNGGVVVADYVMMAEETGARASLRLESGGRLEAQQVQRYDGTGTVVFDGGILRVTNDQFAGLFSGFQTGDVTLAAGGGTIDTGTYQVHMDIGLVGPGGLTKLGTGTFHVWGASSYFGTTLVSAGTLRARETNVLSAASTYDIATGATLRLDNNKNQVIGGLAGAGNVLLGSAQLTVGANDSTTLFSGIISGTGKLVKSGSGTLTLAGNSVYSGDTEILAGTLVVMADANLGATSGRLTFNGGTLATASSFATSRNVSLLQAGTIDVAESTTLSLSGEVSGAGALIKAGAGSLTLSGNNSYGGGTELRGGRLSVSADANLGAASGGLTFNGGTLATTASFDTSRSVTLQQTGLFDVAENTTLGLTGVVSGAGNLRKTGAGTLRLDNAGNGYSNTLVEAGTLIGNAGSISGNISNAGTVVFDQAADATFAGTIAGLGGTSGSMVKQGVGNLTLTGTSSLNWSITGGGLITAAERFSGNADIGTGTSLTFNQDATATYGGVLTGAGRFIKAGFGMLTLSGTNGYSGGTEMLAGALAVSADANLGAASGGLIFNGGVLATTASFDTSRNVSLLQAGGIDVAAGTTLGLTGEVSGNGALIKAGAGTLTLSGTNSYVGGTEILAGMLAVQADANLGAASGGLTFNGGTLATTTSFDTSRSVSLQRTGVFDVAASTTLGLTGVVSGPGDLRKTGAGTLRLDNAGNGYGNTLVEAGTLVGNAGSISGSISNAGTVVFDQATDAIFAGAIAGLGGTSGSMVKQGAGNLTLTGTSSLDWSITAGGLTTAAGRFTGNADIGTGASLTFRQNADASYGGQLTGAGRVIKAGFATLTLTGTNGYSGGTELIGGRLSVSADANLGAASGGLTFNGGTLLATASFDTSRSVSLQHTGVFEVAADMTLGLTGTVSGTGDLQKRGSGTLRLDNVGNSYGNTQVEAGTLIGNARSISGNINNIGTVVFDQATDESFAGTIRGFDGAAGAMVKQGAGNLTLTGTSSLNWSITAGGLITAAERFSGNAKIGSDASLTFDQSADASYAGILSGTGGLFKTGDRSLTLSGNNTYTGATTIDGGELVVNGAIDSRDGGVAVNSGGTLSGMGTIVGQVNVNSGGTLSGFSGRTLTMGSLALSSGATVNVTLGSPSTTALFNVTGNLTLGGTLNVSGSGDFGAGVYRLINYGGTLTNNGLAIGTTPGGTSASDFFVQTAVAGQVNLLNSSGQTLGFWDGSHTVANGTIDGGTGTWSATNTNWTNANGSLNAPYHPNPTFAVFQGTAGTVTVDTTAGAIGVTGLQFVTGGYLIQGGEIALQGASGSTTVRVGDGTAAGASTSATIASVLTGASTLLKDDRGTLILSGNNTYSGGTMLRAGSLSVQADANLGAAATLEAALGGLTFDGGTLVTTASFDTSRSVSLQQTGVFDVATGTTLGLTGVVSGTGNLRKRGSGTLRLDNAGNGYGNTLVEAGTLIGNARSISGNVSNAGTIVFDQATDATFAGAFTGFGGTSGAMVKQGAGTLTLTGNTSLDWSITAGGLITATQRFSGNASIGAGASLTFDQSADDSYGKLLSGAGRFIKAGAGSLTLSGTNSYGGGTELRGGSLSVSADANLGAASGGLTFNGGTLATTGSFDTLRSVSLQHTGVFDVAAGAILGLTGTVSGTSDLQKRGSGTLRLDNVSNSYGNTQVEAGTLIGNARSISGNITNIGTVVFDQATDESFAGKIRGFDGAAGAMVKQGAGKLTLAGISSLNWSITAGGLITAADRFSGNASIGTGASLAFDQSADASYSGLLSGEGRFVKAGAGSLTLSGSNTLSGGTELRGGRLSVSADANLGAASGGLTFDDGTLATTASFDTSRGVSLQQTGTFDVATGTTLGLAGVVSGAGDLVKSGAGTLRLDNTANSYGNTLVQAGTLIGNARSISGNIGNAGAIVFDQAADGAFAGTISGLDGVSGTMVKQGAGNLTLTGTSSLDWTIAAGGLITAAQRFSGNASIGTGAALTFDQASTASYGGVLSGAGSFTKAGNGTLTLSGTNSYTGATTINGGALIVTGAIDSRVGGVAVNGGSTLSGTGTIAGTATVNAGGMLAGTAGSTLTLGGLTLGSGASVNVALGAPSTQALFNVTGNLTLGGTLNVTSQGDFGAGVYRLIDYSGTLTDNGLAIGTTPGGTSAGDLKVQTAVAGQVNLLNSSGQTLGFWDGSHTVANGRIDGGTGTWSTTNTNWTNADGSVNGPYQPNPTYAVFQGTAGTVTVDASAGAIGVTGMQFATDGYRLQGDAIALQGAGGSTTVRVGDGTATGAGMSATVASALTGASALVKDDLGTLILAGNNSYSGGTVLRAGSLSVQADANLGAASGGLTFNGGALATTGSFDISRSVSLQQAGRFDVAAGTTLGLGGLVSGTGDLRKTGTGTLRLDNTANSYGNTLVQAGTLIGNALSISGNIANAGTVVLDQAVDGVFAGMIAGLDGVSGSMVKQGVGNLTLAGTSSLDWTIAAGGLITAAQRLSGNASIGAGASLTFDQSANASYGGGLSGAGGFVKTGAGSLTVTGNNTYTGATTINGGALIVTGAIDSRSGGVAVNNGATLSGTGTVAGPVTVNAGGTLAGAAGSTLTLGSLTLGSGASINVALGAPSNQTLFNVTGNLTLDGTLNVADLGGFGQGVYRIFDYGGAFTNNGLAIGTLPGSTTGEVQTSIDKQVNLVVSESGPTPTILFWNGTTTVPTGTVQGGSGAWGGTTTNWTNADGTRADAWTGVFAVFQATPGTVTVDATGVSVTGLQFATGGYRLTGGPVTLNGAGGSTTVRVGDGTAAGAGFTAVIDSQLAGDSRLVKNDLGTLVLTGTNSYSGGTTIAAGTLQIGNGGTTGSILGDVANNGLLRFARSDATTFGGVISGSGGVQVQSGAVTFIATNSYAGPTTIGTGATLQLGTGGTSGTIAGDVANGGTLIVNLSAAFTYNGVISGNGTIRQIGSGFTSLTGDSSAFTGTTRVENGVLSVNGKLGGTVTVLAGGQLQGSGTISNVAVAGTVAPGNSIGTLSVGNVTFQAGSIYQVEVNADGQSDKIVATGTATLNGGSVQVLAGQGNYLPSTTYTILTAAGGRTGTFSGVTSNLAFLAPSLSYDPDNVYLTLTRNTVSFPSIGGTFNQRQAGAGAESLGPGNPIWNAVVQMDASTAQAAFNQLSGEVHASAKTALYEDSRLVRDGALGRLRQAFGGGAVASSTAEVAGLDEACSGDACQADPGTGIAAWAQGFGSWGYTSTDGNAAGLSRSTGGMLVGVDAPVFDVARLGLFGGYSRTSFNVADRQSSGGSDNVHLGAYGGAQWGPIGVRAGLAYTWHNLSTSRSVAFPGFADSLRATYGAGTFQLFGEAGYRFDVGPATFEPFANIAWMSLSTKGFSETGGAAALSSAAITSNVTTTTVGLRAGSAFTIAGLTGQARGTVGWQHAFTDTTPWANLQLAGGTPFTAAGVPIAQDAALLELGVDLRLSDRASLGIGYTGQFAAGSQDQSVRGNVTFRF